MGAERKWGTHAWDMMPERHGPRDVTRGSHACDLVASTCLFRQKSAATGRVRRYPTEGGDGALVEHTMKTAFYVFPVRTSQCVRSKGYISVIPCAYYVSAALQSYQNCVRAKSRQSDPKGLRHTCHLRSCSWWLSGHNISIFKHLRPFGGGVDCMVCST